MKPCNNEFRTRQFVAALTFGMTSAAAIFRVSTSQHLIVLVAGIIITGGCVLFAQTKPLKESTSVAATSSKGPIAEDGEIVRIGQSITVNKRLRTITFPAWVNQPQGVVEYAIVMRAGKTHEAIFATDADAKDLHVAGLLLNIAAEEIITKPNNESWTVPPMTAVDIEIQWKAHGKERRNSLSEMMILRDSKGIKPDAKFPSTNWWYNGSRLVEGGAFVAQTSGSIVSLIFDPDALINNPGIDRIDDEIHFVNGDLVPPVNTPVTITIHPAQSRPVEKQTEKDIPDTKPKTK